MKLQVPVTTGVAAALAAASISLSLLLLPGGAASVRPSGVAPALKLVAGDVAAAVQEPVRTAARAHPTPVGSSAVSVGRAPARPQPLSSPSRIRSVPAHGSVHRGPVSLKPAVTPTPVTTPAAPVSQPVARLAEHGQGKANAFGHLRKIALLPASASKTAHGRPADVLHGPPSVPPGHEADIRGGPK
jgi:hypothetical protein